MRGFVRCDVSQEAYEKAPRGKLVVKETITRLGYVRKAGTIKPDPEVATRESDGIVVQEGELGSAIAQRFYRMRCECGRSWIELELKKLVKCPACSRLARVHTA